MTYLYRVKYHKYKNPDPSTADFAPLVTDEIIKTIDQYIDKRIKEIYNLRPESVLGIDLKHAVKRELSDRFDVEVAELERFEKENSEDLRNYPWAGSYDE